MNRIFIAGNVGKISTSKTGQGKKVVNFTVATDDSYKDKDGNRVEVTDWFQCVVFQRGEKPGLAGMLDQHLTKGASVLVTGKLKTEKWRKEGEDVDRLTPKVYVEEFEFVGAKRDGGKTQTGPDDDLPPLSDAEIDRMANQQRGIEP